MVSYYVIISYAVMHGELLCYNKLTFLKEHYVSQQWRPDLVLHCLPMSRTKDARLIWVKQQINHSFLTLKDNIRYKNVFLRFST